MSEPLALLACALAASSGTPGLFLPREGRAGERVASALIVAAGLAGLAAAGLAIAAPSARGISLPWAVPGGALEIRADGLSAMFLAQIFFLSALGAIYGLSYWPQAAHPRDGRKLRFFYGLLTAAMGLLVVARNAVLFLAAWEVMALAAFLSLSAEDDKPVVREVGYVYLVATRLGTLCLFAMFALLLGATGRLDFDARGLDPASPTGTAVFLLALAGFGIKAGLMPLHVWLPGAHANAPTHVSSLMSGVLIKMGIYGLARTAASIAHPPFWWGGTLLALGAVSAILGVAFAIGQHDVKRLLAYHSVENIGIIGMGLGLALIGRAVGRPELVLLGLAGALLHVWNHGLFKALLFLAAGAVIHSTGTRDLDRLGGLLRRMPATALLFLVGAVAICGLPPLNGFVSELFLYMGFFRAAVEPAGRWWIPTAFAAPALAAVGALAVACFTKVLGAVFLGQPRSGDALHAHEPGPAMLGPMIALAACCAAIGLAPAMVAPVLDSAAAAFGVQAPIASAVPLGRIALAGGLLLATLALVGLLLALRVRRAGAAPTWDCGYALPTARMQYTSSSFAQMLVGMFSFALRPEEHAPRVAGAFPGPAAYHGEVPDAVLDRLVA
ncbi:MAG TPA: proton-conducting transporter membrane subunit, partial [Myxococcales bacterium]|nr:proton-conducting transporter membrane subunit [Myxococcales bacterium]